MIIGIGFDLTDLSRIERAVSDHGAFFHNRILTASEQREVAESRDPIRDIALRFAAKEACLKALGTGWHEGTAFTDVEVLGASGGLQIQLSAVAAARGAELAVRRVQISTSQMGGTIAALVVLEG